MVVRLVPTSLRCAIVLGALTASPCLFGQQTTERASVDSFGNQANQMSSFASVSADGRYAAFESSASNLVQTGGLTAGTNVYIHDRQTGVTQIGCVDSAGNPGNFASIDPAISSDGRYLVFTSFASNLVPGDTNGKADVFVHDSLSGTTELISVSTAGVQADQHSDESSISGDGRWVAFVSYATNLVSGDTNLVADVFVRDRLTGTTELVSLDSAGNPGNQASSERPSISADGRWVAFESWATNLVPGDTNLVPDVFVRDLLTGTTELVTVDSSGNQASNGGHAPLQCIAGDGRYVVFYSGSTNLSAVDLDTTVDVFVRDRQLGITELISISSSGDPGNRDSAWPSISEDGLVVAFYSLSTNLVPGDVNGLLDVFARDRLSGTTELISISSSGEQGNELSTAPSLSGDGRYVAFHSRASNLVEGDTNGVEDVFVRDRTCSIGSVNYCTAGTSASNCTATLTSTGSPSASAPSGFVVTASSGEGQMDGLFFYGQNGRQANPWGNGTSYQCVVPPVWRGSLQPGNGTLGACDAVLPQDLNALWCPTCPKKKNVPFPGKRLQIQFWYRDPNNTSNQDTSLSDALELPVCP
jgi:Tol biopolymer transport system component